MLTRKRIASRYDRHSESILAKAPSNCTVKTFTTSVPPRFHFWQTVSSHGWAALAPFTFDDAARRLTYTLALSDGSVWELTIREAAPANGASPMLTIDADGGTARLTATRQSAIEAAVRRMFRLDEDLSAFHALCRTEPRLQHVPDTGYERVLRSPTAWEDLVRVIATTNTTWTLTKRMIARLVERYGALHPQIPDRRAFPTPQALAKADPADIKALGWGYRAPYIVENARAIASGKMDLEALAREQAAQLPAAALRKELLRLRGVGDYAAGTLLILLGHYSSVPVDTAARATVSRLFYDSQPVTDKQVKAALEPYQPYAALALYCLMMMD